MVGLIMKHAPSLLAQGRNRPLQKWLESLPREILEKNPCFFIGWVHAAYRLIHRLLAPVLKRLLKNLELRKIQPACF